MNERLAQALATASAALAANPDGHLPLPLRLRLEASWGAGEDGWRHTYALARLAAGHVLPYWDERRPQDRRPHRALELADAVAAGEVAREDAVLEAARIANDLDDMFDTEIDEPTFNAAMAARGTVLAATGPQAPPAAESADDEDRDADAWRTDFFASMVGAPSLPKMKVPEHAEPRRAFWRWYLDEAVPAADRRPFGDG